MVESGRSRESGPRYSSSVLGTESALLVALAGVVLAMLLLAPTFQVVTSSEAREIDVARAMLREGEWISPLRHGVVPSKPPLFHWVAATLGAVRGDVTVAVARVVSLFSAIGVLVLVVLTARTIAVGSSRRESSSTMAWRSLLAGGVLVTTHGFVSQAMLAMVDMLFAFCVTGAICSVLSRAARSNREGSYEGFGWRQVATWLGAFYPWCAFAVLAKGPLGVLLPLLVISAFLVQACGVRNTLRALTAPRWGWVIFLVVALPWYLISGARGGEQFIWRHVLFENVLRMLGSDEMNVEAWWFYLPSLARTAFPWSILGVAVFWFGWRHREGVGRRAIFEPHARVREALLWSGATWLLVGLVFFSIAAGKRHAYLLPLYPGLALLISLQGTIVWEELSYRLRHNTVRVLTVIVPVAISLALGAAVLAGLAGELFPFWGIHLSPVGMVAGGFLREQGPSIAMVVVVSAATYGALTTLSGAYGLALRLVTIVAVLLSTALALGNGIKGALKDPYGVALALQARIPAKSRLAILRTPRDEFFDVVLLHLDRKASFVEFPRESASRAMTGCPAPFLLMRTDVALAGERGGAFRDLALEVQYVGGPLVDGIKGRTDRELILVRCTSVEGGAPPGLPKERVRERLRHVAMPEARARRAQEGVHVQFRERL